MRRRSGSALSIGLIIVLAVALVVAWIGYEPMVMQRMGEDRAADQRCAGAVNNGAPIFRWRADSRSDTGEGANLEYAFIVQNASGSACLARYEVLAMRPTASTLIEGGKVVPANKSVEVVLQLGRYTADDHQNGRVPRAKELKVWGANVPPGRQ